MTQIWSPEFLNSLFLKHNIELETCYSRIHPLKNFPSSQACCYVKRDDELSCGISGSKYRKYASLIPMLLQNKYQEVAVIGGAYSNNVLAASQRLTEAGIPFTLFLLGDQDLPVEGNRFLTNLIVDQANIQYIDRQNWQNVQQIIQKFYSLKNYDPKDYFALEEGASVPFSMLGALTLPYDILRNQEKDRVHFDHIFVDSGTGFTAAALILGLKALFMHNHVHVIQLAPLKKDFSEQLKIWSEKCESLFPPLPLPPSSQYTCYNPSNAKSFGSINATVLQGIRKIATEEGIFTDPIYSAKLFSEARKIILEKKLSGNILIIHSGGMLSLFGYKNLF